MTSPYFLIFAPGAVQHLRAERCRSVQNYPTLLPKGRWEKSTEATPRLKKRQKPTTKLTFLGCIETYQWIDRLRFDSRIAENPHL
uniref:Secreted protein n=1 Tax=Heterorhabditis bacteriophora TaxID=37862 RepID=A0A1I7WHK3_HETBA